MNKQPLTLKKESFLYEGKAKRIYRTNDDDLFWVEYKDDATAFDGQKKGTIIDKGRLNNQISAIFFTLLKDRGIDNHFVQKLSAHEQAVRRVDIIPVEVVVRNFSAGSMAQRLDLEEGKKLRQPVLEFYYKNDELGDPLINDDHVLLLEAADEQQMAQMRDTARQVNQILSDHLSEKGILLVDFKLEFGLTTNNELMLADEISPDTCRFWDAQTQEKLDKDRFRRDLGNVEEAYQTILSRLGGEEHV